MSKEGGALREVCHIFPTLVIFSLFISAAAPAAYMNPRFCGNTSPQLSKGVGGTINFCVLDTKQGMAGDTWGTGLEDFDKSFLPGHGPLVDSSSLDTRARYLYLYQVVNNGLNKVDIAFSYMEIFYRDPNEIMTSWGSFRHAVFLDDDDSTGNPE